MKWPSCKARRALAALLRRGWRVKRASGSHRILAKPGRKNVVFAYHDKAEIGPAMMAELGKETGLKPEEL